MTQYSGTTTKSERPPPQPGSKPSQHESIFSHFCQSRNLPLNPTNPLLSQQFTRPSSHDPQVPSYMIGCTQTRSPTAKLEETSSPTSAIVPLNSCPKVTGTVSLVMGCGVVGQSDGPPRNSWRSQGGCQQRTTSAQFGELVGGLIGPQTVLGMSVLFVSCSTFPSFSPGSWLMDDTYPSANPAPRGFDLDLSLAALGLGHLLESQVLFAVEPHGVHHLPGRRSHDVGLSVWMEVEIGAESCCK
jgi:hypothetical protein